MAPPFAPPNCPTSPQPPAPRNCPLLTSCRVKHPHFIARETEAQECRVQPKVPPWSPGVPPGPQQGGRTQLGLRASLLEGGWLWPRRRELPIWSLRASSLRARFGTAAPPKGCGGTQGHPPLGLSPPRVPTSSRDASAGTYSPPCQHTPWAPVSIWACRWP